MAQNYNIPHELTKKLAAKNSQGLRNALRLWFWLKVHGYHTELYLNDLPEEILHFFQKKSLKNYLAKLVETGWMGHDPRSGKYFLRGRKRMFAEIGYSSKCLAHPISSDNVATSQAWTAFIGACCAIEICRRMNRNSKGKVSSAATPKSGGQAVGEKPETPLSCENISNYLGVSIATASRIRSRAAKEGLITNRVAMKDMSHLFPGVNTKRDLYSLRGELKESMLPVWRQRLFQSDTLAPGWEHVSEVVNPDALLLKDGKVWMQMPNMVSSISIKFKSLSNGKR